MIVFDASTLVGAALKPGSTPERALLHAAATDIIALSSAVDAEIAAVLARPKFAALISTARRDAFLNALRTEAVWFEPTLKVQDCRDAKDNRYLELAATAGAAAIVTSDQDLTVLDPWRGIRILTAAAYLDLARRPTPAR